MPYVTHCPDDDDDDPFGRASTKAATSASAAKDGKGAPTGGGRGSPLVNGKAAVQPQRQLQSVVTVRPSDAPARARAPIGSSAAAKPAEGMAHMLAHLTAQSDAPDGREPKARQSCAAPSSEPALPPPKPKSGFDGDWLDERSSSMPVDSEVTCVRQPATDTVQHTTCSRNMKRSPGGLARGCGSASG
jgi:hypothetical protein